MQRYLPLFVLVLAGCGGKLATIKISDSVSTVVAQGTILESLVGSLGFDGFLNMDVTQAQELRNQGVEPGDIKDVRLTSFVLSVTDPQGGDMSFLQSMTLSVEAPDIDAAEIAHADAFPAGQNSVAFTIDDLDLTPYALSRSMTMTTAVNGHRPDQDTTIKASYSLDIGVTAKGIADAGSN